MTGRVIATIGGALFISATWTPWFFALVGTALVLGGVALLEYGGPYDDSPPTFSPTLITTRQTEPAPQPRTDHVLESGEPLARRQLLG